MVLSHSSNGKVYVGQGHTSNPAAGVSFSALPAWKKALGPYLLRMTFDKQLIRPVILAAVSCFLFIVGLMVKHCRFGGGRAKPMEDGKTAQEKRDHDAGLVYESRMRRVGIDTGGTPGKGDLEAQRTENG